MSEILAKVGLTPAKEKHNELWYHSPFRSEKTPSFHVNVAKNVWYDFGEGKGGDGVAFVSAHLKATGSCHTTTDALRWLRNMFYKRMPFEIVAINDPIRKDTSLVLKDVKPLSHMALVRYLESRGIPFKVAEKYLREIHIFNEATAKHFFAAGIKNEEGGYDYRNPYFKGCVKKKAITFVRGSAPKPEGIHLFEGFMDFLSAVTEQRKAFEDDVIVLNSLSCMQEASGYMRNYGYQKAYTWLDNDPAGNKATHAFSKFFEEEQIKHIRMNAHYAPSKDVNDYHMAMLSCMKHQSPNKLTQEG